MKQEKFKVVATLRYGRFLSGWLLGAMIFLVCLSVATLIFTVGYFCLSRTGLIPRDEDEITYLYATILMICALAFALWFLMKRAKTKKKIKVWLQDAVSLMAHSKSIEVKHSFLAMPQYRIEVDFIYNDQLFIRRSGNPEKNHRSNGLDTIYRRYTNREINILYSPSYDEIMIVKD